jgi:hypothetical protein
LTRRRPSAHIARRLWLRARSDARVVANGARMVGEALPDARSAVHRAHARGAVHRAGDVHGDHTMCTVAQERGTADVMRDACLGSGAR